MAKRKSGGGSSPAKKSGANAGSGNRSRTRERRAERERRQRRQRLITIVVAVVALAVIAFVLIIISNQPAEGPIPEEALTRYADIEQSTTDDGYARLGDPDAFVEVREYSSFDCSACALFHDETLPALLDRVRAGEIAFVYVPIIGRSIENVRTATEAAICAGEQGQFWEMHDTLFSWQRLYGRQAFLRNRISDGVENLGLDREAYDTCKGSSLPDDVLEVAVADAQALEDLFIGTPTITVMGNVVVDDSSRPTNDLDYINAAIDEALSHMPAQPSPEATDEAAPEMTAEPEITVEATTEPEATVEPTADPLDEPVMETTDAPEVTPETTSAPGN
jgi:protein-disulfide isomerase